MFSERFGDGDTSQIGLDIDEVNDLLLLKTWNSQILFSIAWFIDIPSRYHGIHM